MKATVWQACLTFIKSTLLSVVPFKDHLKRMLSGQNNISSENHRQVVTSYIYSVTFPLVT